jgi:hypothetical protein
MRIAIVYYCVRSCAVGENSDGDKIVEVMTYEFRVHVTATIHASRCLFPFPQLFVTNAEGKPPPHLHYPID